MLLALALSGGSSAHAQVLYGTITGNITDPSGAAVPSVKVEAVDSETGAARQVTTDDRGSYTFSNLQLGVYRLTVAAPSFRTVVENNLRVNANEVRRADFKLQIAQSSDQIVVTAEGIALQTDKADVHETISSQQVDELPYTGGQGRNFQSLYALVPGAAPPNEQNSDAGNPQRAQQVFMNGVSSTNQSTKLDGTTIAYPWLPRLIAYVPPSDAIETVNIATDAFDAEQGTAGGIAVNVSIKSGTNRFHGSLYEYHTNSVMKARNYFDYSGTAFPKNILNQFGFSFGGPVWIPKLVTGRNKLFFFVDWQRTMRRQFASSTGLSVPTVAMRQGNFSGTGTTIYDPLTGNPDGTGRLPFANNIIPANRIDPASAKMASLLPDVTQLPGGNYNAYGSYSFDRDNVDVKINYNPTDKAILWTRYSVSPMDIVAPQVFGAAGGDAFNAGQPGHAGGRVQTAAIGGTYTFSPTVLFDGNVGYTRQNIGATGDVQNGQFGLNVLNIPGTNGPDPQYWGIPAFYISGLSNLGNASTGSPFTFRDNQYTTAINMSKQKGAHALRFGFQYDHSALNHFQPQGGTTGVARGAFTFNGTLTALKGGATQNQYNAFADFLLGYPSQFGKVTQLTNPNSLRFSDYSMYARDQWQVSQRLTLSYGLRWEHYPIFSHDHYGAVRFDPATGKVLVGGFGGVPWDTGASPGYKDFAPRLGIAYRLGNKTVIRSGYGISVDPDNFRNQRNSYPSTIFQSYSQPNTYQFATTPFTSQASLRTGIPPVVLPDITQGILTPPSSTTTSTFPANFDRGYIQSYNFVVQRELGWNMVAEAGYVGTHAVHTLTAVNINAAPPGGGNSGRVLAQYLTTDLNEYMPFGSQKYNSLQTKWTKRFNASQIGVRYTFSKALNTNDTGDDALQKNLPASWSLDKGLAGFDRTHNLQVFHIYRLPFGKGQRFVQNGIASKIIGGWETSGITSYYSGTPFTITASGGSCNCPGQTQTADQVLSNVAILGGHGNGDPYFNPLAFGQPADVRFGTTGRNVVRGPGTFNINASLSRNFVILEKLRLNFRGEAFNLTNTPQFGNPGASVNSATFSADRSSVISYGGFGIITSASNERQLRVSARITF